MPGIAGGPGPGKRSGELLRIFPLPGGRDAECAQTRGIGTGRIGLLIQEVAKNILPEVKKAEKKGLPISELSRSYYQNYPTTAEEVDQAWGKPVAVRPLEDGSEERYYNMGVG